jgi:DNA polymerase-3 subunit delta
MQIELKHLENGLATQKAAGIFEFTDALGFKKAARASAFLEDLLKHGEPPLKILTMIARQMRMLLKAKLSKKSGAPSERSKTIGVHPYFLKTLDQQADGWQAKALKSTFGKLAKIDERIKSEAVRPEDELRLLVLQLCSA